MLKFLSVLISIENFAGKSVNRVIELVVTYDLKRGVVIDQVIHEKAPEYTNILVPNKESLLLRTRLLQFFNGNVLLLDLSHKTTS